MKGALMAICEGKENELGIQNCVRGAAEVRSCIKGCQAQESNEVQNSTKVTFLHLPNHLGTTMQSKSRLYFVAI